MLGACTSAVQAPSVCPPVTQYTKEQTTEALRELHTIPDNSELEQMLKDYKIERNKLEACRNG